MTDKFHVGQRVRKKALFNGIVKQRPVGTVGRITGARRHHMWCDGTMAYVYTTDVAEWFPTEELLEPLPDDEAFKRFMSRTLEPLKETA